MKAHIQQIKDDFRNARHNVEDRLSLGAAFDRTVRDFFYEDPELMRDFVRDCRLDCLRDSFHKNRHHAFSDSLLLFVKHIEDMRKLEKKTDIPYIAATTKLFEEIEDSLRIARLMRENNCVPSALLVEERILSEFMPRMRDMNDRNRVRGLVMMHQLGI